MDSEVGQELAVRLSREASEQIEHVVDITVDVSSRLNSPASTSVVEGLDLPDLGESPRSGIRGMTVAFKVWHEHRCGCVAQMLNLGQAYVINLES